LDAAAWNDGSAGAWE